MPHALDLKQNRMLDWRRSSDSLRIDCPTRRCFVWIHKMTAVAESGSVKKNIPPVLVLSTRQCGSTMLSDNLNTYPRVLSLSETFTTVGQEVLYLSARRARYTHSDVSALACTMLPHLTDECDALFDELGAGGAGVASAMPQRALPSSLRMAAPTVRARRVGGVVRRVGAAGVAAHARLPGRPHRPHCRNGRDTALSMRNHYVFYTLVAATRAVRSAGIERHAFARRKAPRSVVGRGAPPASSSRACRPRSRRSMHRKTRRLDVFGQHLPSLRTADRHQDSTRPWAVKTRSRSLTLSPVIRSQQSA